MKRFAFTFAALSLSSGVLAAYPASNDSTLITIPQFPGEFFFGGSALYAQPSFTHGDLDYASLNTNTVSSNNSGTFNNAIKDVGPGYDWGWGINAGFTFPNTGNDINLNYLEFNSSAHSFVQESDGVTPTNITILGDPYVASSGEAKAEYDLNQVDLTAGQYINVGCRLILHPNVGLRWAEVDRTMDSNFTNSLLFTGPSLIITAKSSAGENEQSNFSGIGPIAALDASYYLGMGFGAVMHADSALLIGDIDTKNIGARNSFVNLTFTDSPEFSFSTVEADYENFNSGNIRRFVPATDIKLGANYTYVFNTANSGNSDMTLELGWMASKYYNAVDRLKGDFGVVGVSPTYAIQRTTSNFGLQGPYASLVFHI